VRGSPLSINTDSLLKVNADRSKESTIESPLAPPPLQRKGIISLPGTPTNSFSASALPQAGPSTPSTPYHFPGLQVNVSATTTSIPQPISPNTLMPRQPTPSLQPTPSTSYQSFSSLSPPQVNGSSRASETRLKMPRLSNTELKAKADDFYVRHIRREDIFRHWRKKTADSLAWKEACRRSEEYKHKLQQSPNIGSNIPSMSSSSSFKRQRSISSLNEPEPSRNRRKQKRISTNGTDSRTDEELVERLTKVNRNRRFSRSKTEYATRTKSCTIKDGRRVPLCGPSVNTSLATMAKRCLTGWLGYV
jgi:nuclear mRNA export protein SAC3